MAVGTWFGSVVAATISAGPAYYALSRGRGTTQQEGEATRAVIASVRDELRSDIREVRDWQAAHTAEHAVYDARRSPRLELRKNDAP